MQGFKDFIESIFDKHADYWLKKTNVPKTLQTEIDPFAHKDLKILDLGCGGGRLARSMLSSFASIHGIDQSKELIQRASKINPEINYTCADFQSPQTWKSMGQFDVIVSNCALRKDYCGDLHNITTLCYDHLNRGGALILRIQAYEDLHTILPKELRQSIFYNEMEVRKALSAFSQTTIKHEAYRQKFSSVKYIQQFLKKININYRGPINDLQPPRHYYIVKAIR